MAKRKQIYVETYKSGSETTDKQEIIDLINAPTTKIFAINAGKYDDGRMFMTFKIDDI